MKTVHRHHYDRDARDLFPHAEQMIAIVYSELRNAERPVDPDATDPASDLEHLASTSLELACTGAAAGDEKRALRGLRLLTAANALLFELAAHPDTPIQAAIEEQTYRLVLQRARLVGLMPGQQEWRESFSAACALRAATPLERLAALSRDAIRPVNRFSKNAQDEFLFAWMAGLQALVRRDGCSGDLLAAALNGASRVYDDDDVQARLSAEVFLALRLHEGEARAFNDALEHALLAHRSFWSQPPKPDDFTEDRREHPHGFLALGPLGLACVAHDRGIPIEVESDYIPGWIVRRQW